MDFVPRNSQRLRVLIIVLFAGTVTSIAEACLWDWDTLQMERRRFPGVLETITGKFVRHSPAYYEWRIRDRTERLKSAADDPALIDDLAVAYSKLGRHADAIALLERTLDAHPDRYETLANLGTIHMLAGDLQTGKQYIDRAIVINPNAHFGREKYQSLLADWFLTARKTPHPASEDHQIARSKERFHGFAEFVLNQRGFRSYQFSRDELKVAKELKAELAAAQKGVLGMMHFANYDSPLLLEALGDLLLGWPSHEEDAVQLAARAYYRVAQKSDDEAVQKEFKKAAANVVYGNQDYIENWEGEIGNREYDQINLDKLTGELEIELADAEAYRAAIAADEKRWIAQGIDVDQAFAAKYYESLDSTIDVANKQLARERYNIRLGPGQRASLALLIYTGILIAIVVVVFFVFRFVSRCFATRARRDDVN